jgi:LacI family fructose operon transcriptional repressor
MGFVVKRILETRMGRGRKSPVAAGKPTIYDIARLGGASPSTVSSVLNGTWKARRISEETARRIEALAGEHGYSPNMQARGLRRAQSGLIGMILPLHDNRFFASLSQSFEVNARERGWCPVIASTLRNPEEEIRIVKTLISYAIDYLFIAGATDPAALGELCAAAGVPHVFIDLPGDDAPSVVSNNFGGAEALSRKLRELMAPQGDDARDKLYFFGGDATDYATKKRIEGFRSVELTYRDRIDNDQIISCGYSPARAAREIEALCDRLGGMPSGLLVNSLTAFEGVMSHFVRLPPGAFDHSVIGCYDYDPFAAYLRIPVHMVRQNSHGLISRAYDLVDSGETRPIIVEVDAELIPPQTIYKNPLSELG